MCYNVCYTIALYYLLIFYVGCEELLEVWANAASKSSSRVNQQPSAVFIYMWQQQRLHKERYSRTAEGSVCRQYEQRLLQ